MLRYIDKINSLIQKVSVSQERNIEEAAKAIAEAISEGKMVYTFGTGHSHILAEEIFYRAGGLVRVYPILEDAIMLHTGAFRSSCLERLPGYAGILIDQYTDISHGDIMILFSNSGRNTVTVEMAQEAAKRGMLTICITSLLHSACTKSRHPDGLKLCDICDIVIDNCGEPGDACLQITEDIKCGPTSTVIGAMILQATICRAVELLTEDSSGDCPEIFFSSNVDGGDEFNTIYYQKYKGKIRIL